MEKSLKGTKTEANLMAAFAGESQARNKYTYYASKAIIYSRYTKIFKGSEIKSLLFFIKPFCNFSYYAQR